ncbi:ABC transporter substrate-binding protein [Bradyrhizobium sp. AUGA SZCCT0160]|uniref:ABC transporter substrate-binding protein n=1 Tax=Bradyrhizobium sp. AUGA SZCCT0160 TaxID=2807662 RepID=UPI001BAB5DFD|nr:ABC transporter substrate-binding protein [Bradyrhizobium sp. AUGA SZCCT0160]MBR1192402.1 ABC transporter substrate-binding protein [Bradyrhizobium sp. AUGA SZCCT0160]
MNAFRKTILAATCVGSLMTVAVPALAQTTLRAVMHSDLKILDPIWTTAYIVRNHGYMIYDTLLAQDEKGEVKPQMVEKYEAAADGKSYTFTLRDGLLWHDGKPVTSEDCIASIKRWAVKDSLGQKMMTFVDSIDAADAKTFTIKLKEPTGLVLLGLSKPSSNVPFMMPKRVAETDANKQIEDFTGSGPFVFVKDEWKPGDKTVYIKFDKYKPRAEPASGLAGGKVVKVDRVEWRAISDAQQAVNALQKGEIDYIEQPSHDLLGTLKKDANVAIVQVPQIKAQYVFRPNHLHKPFDNPKIRQALWYAFNQEDFLMATIGDENYIKACKALFVCDTQFGTTNGTDAILNSNAKKSQELLKEAGYDGTPVLLMHSTDLKALTNLAPVAKSLMEKGGFKVDMQSMDWQTLVARRAKKDPPNAGGWNAFLTAWVVADVMNPVSAAYVNSGCDKASFGWPCDPEMEKLRDDFARTTDLAKQKQIAEAVQKRNIEITAMIPVGEYVQPIAIRKNVKGLLMAPVPVHWNIEVTK